MQCSKFSGVGGRSKAMNRVRGPLLLTLTLVLAIVVTGSAAQTRDCLPSSNDDVWLEPDGTIHDPVDVFFVRVTPGYWYTGWIYTDDRDDDFDLYIFDRRDVLIGGDDGIYVIIADPDDAICSATSSSGRESCTFPALPPGVYVFIVVPYSGWGCYTVGID